MIPRELRKLIRKPPVIHPGISEDLSQSQSVRQELTLRHRKTRTAVMKIFIITRIPNMPGISDTAVFATAMNAERSTRNDTARKVLEYIIISLNPEELVIRVILQIPCRRQTPDSIIMRAG